MATPIKPLTGSTPTGGGFSLDLSFLGGTTFWVFVVVGLIFGIICFFWITRKERKDDPFMRDFRIKKNQCKMFKDETLDKVYIENQKDGLIKLGKYEGEALDKEGYHNIMFSKLRFGKIGGFLRKVLFFTRPILDLLLKKYWIVRCNVNPVVFFNEEKVMKDNKVKLIPKKYILPIPTITKGKGSLIMHCEGLQLKKYYTYPILRGFTGNIVKDEDKNFMRERDSVLIDTLYQQSVLGDTEIISFRNGMIDIRKIEDFDSKKIDYTIQCFDWNTNRIVLQKPSKFERHLSQKDGYEIITSYNNRIRLTGDHSVFTWKPKTAGVTTESGSIALSEVRNLKKGGWIVIPNKMKVVERDIKEFDLSSCKNHKHIYKLKERKTIKVSNDILWTLGMFASEGWFDKNTVHFSTDAENINRLEKIFKKEFDLDGKFMHYIYTRKNGSKVRILRLSFHSAVIADMFRILMKDRNWILQLPLERLRCYVHGIWCGDGWHNGKYKELRQITITTSVLDEAEFIRKLLLRFGVLSGVYTQKYGKEIKFWGLKLENDGSCVNYHVTASGLSETDIVKWDVNVSQSQGFKRIGDLTLAKINSIKKFKINEHVYDFSVPKFENFIGNNVCCHNTIDFSNAMREAINLNPNVRYVVKTEGRAMPEGGGGQ
jgi:intein/homing endonuclease